MIRARHHFDSSARSHGEVEGLVGLLLLHHDLLHRPRSEVGPGRRERVGREEVGGWEEGEVQGDRVESGAVVLVEGAQAFLDFPFIEPLLEGTFMESIKYLVLLLHLLIQTKLRHDGGLGADLLAFQVLQLLLTEDVHSELNTS